MRVIVMADDGASMTGRDLERRYCFGPSGVRQMTMGSTHFQQTGIGDTGSQGEHPHQQHQESGVAFGKGAGKKFHGDMRKD